jgi:hypothetical protein
VSKSGDGPQGPWWSITQAIVWIVKRDRALTERAANIREIQALESWELDSRQPAPGESPPIPLMAAPAELLRAAAENRIVIRGRFKGTGGLHPVPVGQFRDARLRDYLNNGPTIGDVTLGHFSDHAFWADLWVDSAECVDEWRGPTMATRQRAGLKKTKRRGCLLFGRNMARPVLSASRIP